mmetsp:Transcript_36299/g.81758  ORF Transcript_36299/g.81758 Transcript_36299/m.81758 type:complete len:238 (-) Transcript_36299:230-943(-)
MQLRLVLLSSFFCAHVGAFLSPLPPPPLKLSARPSSSLRLQSRSLTLRCQLSPESKLLASQLKEKPFFAKGRVGGDICARAFENDRFVTDSEIADGKFSAARAKLMKILRDNEVSIIGEARKKVYDEFPGIAEPGGGLYPPIRAESCWRDFSTFLKIVSYGTLAGNPVIADEEGSIIMGKLYREMKVPLDAMEVGVKGLRDASFEQVRTKASEVVGEWPECQATFNHLIDVLRSYSH